MVFQLSGTQIVGPAERIKTWVIWRTSVLEWQNWQKHQVLPNCQIFGNNLQMTQVLTLVLTKADVLVIIGVSLKFICSEKDTKFCEIFTLLLSYVVPVKSKVKISQYFVAFSEYMNFKRVIFNVEWFIMLI